MQQFTVNRFKNNSLVHPPSRKLDLSRQFLFRIEHPQAHFPTLGRIRLLRFAVLHDAQFLRPEDADECLKVGMVFTLRRKVPLAMVWTSMSRSSEYRILLRKNLRLQPPLGAQRFLSTRLPSCRKNSGKMENLNSLLWIPHIFLYNRHPSRFQGIYRAFKTSSGFQDTHPGEFRLRRSNESQFEWNNPKSTFSAQDRVNAKSAHRLKLSSKNT